MKLIGSAESGYVHLNLLVPKFGRVNAGFHLEFLQSVNRGKHGVGIEAGIGILHAVQSKIHILAARAGDKDLLCSSIAALARAGLASIGDAIVGDVGGKSDQLGEAPTVQRQIDNPVIVNYGSYGGALRGE